MNFSSIKAVVMDMDGVLWRGDEALPGLVAFFEWLRGQGIPFALATNNSSKSGADYVKKLAVMGVPNVPEENILTSGKVTATYLQGRFAAGTWVYVVGGNGLRETLTGAGFVLADEADTAVQIVAVGLDTAFSYERLKRASLYIQAGAFFVGTNGDVSIPTPEGLSPGAGSIIAAIRTASQVEPVIIGKPGAPMFEAALALLGTQPSETLMIGDRMDTDITGAAAVGLRTALVLTGVTTRADLQGESLQPDGVFDDLTTLLTALSSL